MEHIALAKHVQGTDLAGKTKLTSVSIGHGGHKRQFFVMLEHDERGAAKLPMHVLDKLLTQAGVRRGDTYTVS